MSKLEPLPFEIVWLGWDEAKVGTDVVKRRDLTAAIGAACNRLLAGRGHAADAHGFFVRVLREEES